MSDKTKRKNDAPRSRRPLLIGLMALLLLIGLMGLGMTSLMAQTDPAGNVYYGYTLDPTTDVFFHVDLKTGRGEREAWPVPQATTVGYQDPDPEEPRPWQVVEMDVPGELQKELVVQSPVNNDVTHVLGRFYVHPFRQDLEEDYSIDGEWYVFSTYHDREAVLNDDTSPRDLWLANLITGEVRQLTDNTYDDHGATFSPDGASLVYLSSPTGTPQLYVMELATGASRLLAPDLPTYQGYFHAMWSPDRQWLSFITYDPQTSEPPMAHQPRPGSLYIMRGLDGTPRPLISEPVYTYVWSFDSAWILFSKYDLMEALTDRAKDPVMGYPLQPYYEERPTTLDIIRPDGTDRKTIDSARFPFEYLDWIP